MSSTHPLKSSLSPLHPGTLLREDIIPVLDISLSQLAKYLGVSRQNLHNILCEEAPVTPLIALRLGKLCGNGPDLWLTLQARHDLDRLARVMQEELSAIPTLNVGRAKNKHKKDKIVAL